MNNDYTTLELLEIGMNSKMLIESIVLPQSPEVSETYGPFFPENEFREIEYQVFSREYTKDIIINNENKKRHYMFPNGGILTFNMKTRTVVSKDVPTEVMLRLGLVK